MRKTYLLRIVNRKPNAGCPLGGVDVPLEPLCVSNNAGIGAIPKVFPCLPTVPDQVVALIPNGVVGVLRNGVAGRGYVKK